MAKIKAGAVPAAALKQAFPPIRLPIQPPFPPMEARLVSEIPSGPEWVYEPKWDGFRCLAFRRSREVLLQSKAGQPLGRYFPELAQAFLELAPGQFVLDGEIVIVRGGTLSFDDLLLRIHPAASRIRRLAQETPASFLCFDLLVDETGKSLAGLPLSERRRELQKFFLRIRNSTSIRLSPSTPDRSQALRWASEGATSGLDGVMAKRADLPYASAERTAMQKVKRIRTADCVVGGFRYAAKGRAIGSLLLGLYNEAGRLDHIGFTSSFTAGQRYELKRIVEPLTGGEGFSGKAPGGPSRWSTERRGEWEPLAPKLVCEVRYDYFSGGRFRHGAKFLRWRPEKLPRQCTFSQVREPAGAVDISALLAA
ncbi:MAG: ATP-dependent DNA ligase [Acidobacteria bacterium]|nr:ATP-dependent DNA ligase [Acidobacteriota bacterium]